MDVEAEDGELLPEALPIGGLEVALQVCQQAVELLTQPAREPQGDKASAWGSTGSTNRTVTIDIQAQ